MPISQPQSSQSLLSWNDTIAYFRSRKAVCFYSYVRFWEPHAFVQQSLAKLLTQNNIHVYWREGDNWRKEKPILYWKSEFLKVEFGSALPGRSKSSFMQRWDANRFGKEVQKQIDRFSDPVIWVQAGLREELAEKLPYIDVFSTFDDPFHFPNHSTLLERSRVRIAQNSFTQSLHEKCMSTKDVLFPPVELSTRVGSEKSFSLPKKFPKKIMGYIGSFFNEDYDLDLFEYLVRTLPDWGFVLAGRTNEAGEGKLARLSRYPNFHRFHWVPKEELASLWKQLSVSLLLHRPRREQYGAFPTKLLESTYYGVPCVGTDVPKTKDIAEWFPMTSFSTELRRAAVEVAKMDKAQIRKVYESLSAQMDPKQHLIQVASRLANPMPASLPKAA